MRRIASLLAGLSIIVALGIPCTDSSMAAQGPKDLTINIGIATMAPPQGKDSATFTLKEPINDKAGNPPFITNAKGDKVGNPKWTPTYQPYNVAVPKIDPVPLADRTDKDKISAASKAKADVFATAIGTAIGDNTRVTVIKNPMLTPIQTGTMPNPNYKPQFPITIFNQPFLPVYSQVQLYQVVVTNINKMDIKTNYTGEYGDGIRFGPGAGNPGGGSSPGSMGSMKGYSIDASGMDVSGNPSFVQFSTDDYESVLYPYAGETDAMILEQIAEDLTAHGISALFDATMDTLILVNPLIDGNTLDFGWTDTTLSFDVALDNTEVPEPSPLLVLASMLVLFGFAPPVVSHARPAGAGSLVLPNKCRVVGPLWGHGRAPPLP